MDLFLRFGDSSEPRDKVTEIIGCWMCDKATHKESGQMSLIFL